MRLAPGRSAVGTRGPADGCGAGRARQLRPRRLGTGGSSKGYEFEEANHAIHLRDRLAGRRADAGPLRWRGRKTLRNLPIPRIETVETQAHPAPELNGAGKYQGEIGARHSVSRDYGNELRNAAQPAAGEARANPWIATRCANRSKCCTPRDDFRACTWKPIAGPARRHLPHLCRHGELFQRRHQRRGPESQDRCPSRTS